MAASVVQGVLLQAPLVLPGAQASVSQPSCCRAATDNAHFYGSMSVRLSLSPSTSVSSDVSCSGEDSVLLSIRTGSRCRSREIVCMAHPRRVKMVQQQIQRELADMLLHDKVLQAAVLPEAALGADMYLSSMATISDVEISKDLQVAKVFISVYGDEREQDIALEGLKAKAKYVRMGLGKRMSLRMTPEVRFIKDESLERGSRVLELLDKVKKERERKERREIQPNESTTSLADDVGAEDDFEDEEEDEVARAQVKRKSKVKFSASATSRKLVEEEDDINWDSDEFKDLNFGEDENIIFIK